MTEVLVEVTGNTLPERMVAILFTIMGFCYYSAPMQIKRDSMRKTIRLLLLGILLATQTIVLAHEVMHVSDGETELCDICRIHGSSPAIPSVEQDDFFDGLRICVQLQFRSSFNGIAGLANFRPRAPPVSSES